MSSKTYRYYKILLLLSFSFLVLGVLGFVYIRSMDRAYSDLIDVSLDPLSQIIAIEKNSLELSMDYDLAASMEGAEAGELRARAAVLRKENARLLDNLKPICISMGVVSEWIDTLKARDEALAKSGVVVIPRVDPRYAYRRVLELREFRTAYSNYLSRQMDLASALRKAADRQNDLLTAKTNRITLLFALMAAWPLLVGVCVFVYALISTIRVFFKNRNGTGEK